MNKREKIVQRVRALRNRAANAASSESEVVAAADRVARLIAEHELTELELREEAASGISEDTHNKGRATMHPAMRATSFSVSKLTECELFWRGGEVEVIGFGKDVEFAMYLCELIQAASERAWKLYLRRSGRHSTARIRQSFMMGFGETVRNQLERIIAERDEKRADQQASEKTGRAIVPLKGALIADHISETKGDIAVFRSRKSTAEPDTHAALEGLKSGARLELKRPIGAPNKRAEMIN